ncbi:MAG: phospholipase D-like domain-containing protein [Anaerolineales bacterium]|nr:phospholipase D-like domain-containing protein [Anaerolineales bacterium]
MKLHKLLLALTIVIQACASTVNTPTKNVPTISSESSMTESPFVLTPVELGAGYGVRGAWFELYFTEPFSSLASQKTGGPDGPLVKAIDAARLSVDVAVYSLSLNSIRAALIHAYQRGVRVRMVMESDNMDGSDPRALKDAGIPMLGDRREGLMHDKFVVIDNSEVWGGSMNFTDSGAYADNNNLIRIRSVKMAENYTKEFEEMFVDDKFGPDIVKQTPNPRVTIDGTPIDVYFSPDDGVAASLLDLLNEAQSSIYFLAFSFTADDLGDAMRARFKDGVDVKGVMETDQIKSNVGTEYDAFLQAGVDVRPDGNNGLMHHKVIIIDKQIVVLGSYNFSNSAETKNDENVMVVYNPEISAQYLAEFERVYERTQAP